MRSLGRNEVAFLVFGIGGDLLIVASEEFGQRCAFILAAGLDVAPCA